MAATNYTPIQLYFSTTASAVPLAANLAQGELAINITDGKLYYEDNGGVVQVIATKGAGTIGGSTTQIQYNNAGALAGNAAMTFNSGTSTTTLTTLNLTNALGATYGGTAQSAYAQGDVLYASATNTLSKLGIGTVNYILTSTGSVPQWVAPTSVTVQTANNLAGGVAGSVPYQSALDTTTFLAIGAANRVMTSTGSAPQWVTSLTGLTGVSSSSITNTSLTSGRVVISSTAGLEADSANLTFNGTTLSTTGISNTGLSTLVKTLTLGDTGFSGTAVFAAATPAKLYIGTGTVTDVTSAVSATNATGAISSLAITPIAATNTSVTYTNASTLYIAGAPSAGTNVTITNPYSLYIAAGASYFAGNLTVGSLTSGRVTYAGASGLLTDSSALTYNGTDTLTSTKFSGALNGTVGATTPSTGAFTTLSASSTVTLSGGTANGVAYLNGSNVLTTGSALTFDGSQFKSATSSNTPIVLDTTGGTAAYLQLKNTGGSAYIGSASGDLVMYTTGSAVEGMRLTSTSLYTASGINVGIGTSNPVSKLQIKHTTNVNTAFRNSSVASLTAGTLIDNYNDAFSATVPFYVRASSFSFGTDSGGNYAEKAIIDSSGNLLVGGTSNAANARLISENASGNQLGLRYTSVATWYNSVDSSGNYIWTKDGSEKARIDSSGTFRVKGAGTAGSTDAVQFSGSAPASAMTLDASGNLGVGTTSPTSRLHVAKTVNANSVNTIAFFDDEGTTGGTSYQNRISISGKTGAGNIDIGTTDSSTVHFGSQACAFIAADTLPMYLYQSSNQPILFATNATERARIDSSGNLGIGTTSPVSKLHVAGTFTITGAGQAMDNGQAINMKNTSGTLRQAMVVDGSNNLGLGGTVDGGILFYTSAGNERARIDSSGNLLVGTTSAANSGVSAGFQVQYLSGGGSTINIGHPSSAGSGYSYTLFSYNNGIIGSIGQNGTTAVSYNTSSDYRLKNTIAPMTGALAKVALLKPCTYKWNADGSDGEGFIAHELAEVVPQCVTGEKDAIDADGKPIYQGIDTSFLVATLTAAIQEQQALIVNIQTEIATLKAKVGA